MTAMKKKIPHEIAQLFLKVNLIPTHITAALVLPLRVPVALHRATLVCVKRYYVMEPICGR